MPQWRYVYNGEGRLLVDFIGRTENMDDDFRKVCHKIGIEPAYPPKTNRSFRAGNAREHLKFLFGRRKEPARRDYKGYYDAETREIVEDMYRQDLELFDYGFRD